MSALSLLQTTPPHSVLLLRRASPQPLLSPNSSIQRFWLPQLMGTEPRKGVSWVALPAHLSKEELLAAQQKQKGVGNCLICCCIYLQCMFPCTLRQHINVTYTFTHQAQGMLQSHSYFHSIYYSITSIAPVILLQKDQIMRTKPETLHSVTCQSTSVMAVIHSIKIFNPKGRYSPLVHFTTASAPWWSELGKQLKDDVWI